jgi:hypothetical protein
MSCALIFCVDFAIESGWVHDANVRARKHVFAALRGEDGKVAKWQGPLAIYSWQSRFITDRRTQARARRPLRTLPPLEGHAPSWPCRWRATHRRGRAVGGPRSVVAVPLEGHAPSWPCRWRATHRRGRAVGGPRTVVAVPLEGHAPSWPCCWRATHRRGRAAVLGHRFTQMTQTAANVNCRARALLARCCEQISP